VTEVNQENKVTQKQAAREQALRKRMAEEERIREKVDENRNR
jgi:hypothetical protein